MSSDILERLRSQDRDQPVYWGQNMKEAADEIERLRVKVERLSDAGDALAQLACQSTSATTIGDWGAALVDWLEARRER